MSELIELKPILKRSVIRTPVSAQISALSSFLSPTTQALPENTRTHEVEKSIWCHEYADDIRASLKESEKRRRTLDYKTQQISYRPSLLLLMKTAVDRMSLTRTTLHLAVHILDCFMDTYTIVIEKLNASALMCLFIAAKVEEVDPNLPKLAKFNALVGNVYSTQELKMVERKIGCSLNFDFIQPTAATFVESYSNQLVSLDDYLHCKDLRLDRKQRNKFSTFESMVTDTSMLLFNVLDISLNDHRLVNHAPSVIGAACMATTRMLKKIVPIWPERLVSLTGYDFLDILPYVEALELLYTSYAKKENVCDSPDSGIASDSRSDSEEDDYDVVSFHPAAKRRRIF